MSIREKFGKVVGGLRESRIAWVEEAAAWWMHDPLQFVWKPDGGMAERIATDIALADEPDRLPGRFVREALTWAKSDDTIRRSIAEFDALPNVLGTPLGPIDLTTHSGMDVTVPWPITMSTVAVPSYTGTGRWDTFIAEAVPDEPTRLWLQLWAGSVLAGRADQACLLFCYGKGGTGKSKFAEALMYALGDYGCTIPSDIIVGRGGADGPYWKATLKGKRLGIVNETPEGEYWNAPQMKSLTGGDTIHARHPYGRPFCFNPSHSILVVANDPPHLSKVDSSITRRLAVVGFNAVPKRRELDLAAQLRADAANILGWCQAGLVALNDLYGGDLMATMPDAVRASTSEYLDEVDTVGEWLSENTEQDWNWTCSPTTIWGDYRRYCEDRGRKPKSWQNLRNDLVGREVIRYRRANGKREVVGLRVPEAWSAG